jgi:hypothetical protein
VNTRVEPFSHISFEAQNQSPLASVIPTTDGDNPHDPSESQGQPSSTSTSTTAVLTCGERERETETETETALLRRNSLELWNNL